MSDIEMHYRFERYWEENASKDTWANKSVAFNIWQSQQAKIDELQAKYDELNNRATGIALDQMATAKLNCELQGRIDEALNFYNTAKSDVNIGVMQMAIYLKGNKDEN